MNQEIVQVKKMLEALLKSDSHIHWIGGYAYGRTADDKPFVILYPAADDQADSGVRVYEPDFKKLPPFIPIDHVQADTDANPEKKDAQEAGIYHECPVFKIVTYSERVAPTGAEKRFGAVLCVPATQDMSASPVGSTNGSGTRLPSTRRHVEPLHELNSHWRVQASMAEKAAVFDTAIARLEPWFEDSTKAGKFRATLFGEWEAGKSVAYLAGMEVYAAQRRRLRRCAPVRQAHRAAKVKALEAYWRASDDVEE